MYKVPIFVITNIKASEYKIYLAGISVIFNPPEDRFN